MFRVKEAFTITRYLTKNSVTWLLETNYWCMKLGLVIYFLKH